MTNDKSRSLTKFSRLPLRVKSNSSFDVKSFHQKLLKFSLSKVKLQKKSQKTLQSTEISIEGGEGDRIPQFISFQDGADEPHDHEDYSLGDYTEENSLISKIEENLITTQVNERKVRKALSTFSKKSSPKNYSSKRTPKDIFVDIVGDGEWKDILIDASKLNFKIYPTQELKDTLYQDFRSIFFNYLRNQPAVGIIFAYDAENIMEVGDLLYSVNNQEIFDVSEALKQIQLSTSRRVHLSFYSPRATKNYCEGSFMTNINDSTNSDALSIPKSSEEWDASYIALGGINEGPDVIHIYKSKRDYDIATIEQMNNSQVNTVKAHKISLFDYRIIDRAQGAKSIHYDSQKYEWSYLVLQPRCEGGDVIQIASMNHSTLTKLFSTISRTAFSLGRRRSINSKKIEADTKEILLLATQQ